MNPFKRKKNKNGNNRRTKASNSDSGAGNNSGLSSRTVADVRAGIHPSLRTSNSAAVGAGSSVTVCDYDYSYFVTSPSPCGVVNCGDYLHSKYYNADDRLRGITRTQRDQLDSQIKCDFNLAHTLGFVLPCDLVNCAIDHHKRYYSAIDFANGVTRTQADAANQFQLNPLQNRWVNRSASALLANTLYGSTSGPVFGIQSIDLDPPVKRPALEEVIQEDTIVAYKNGDIISTDGKTLSIRGHFQNEGYGHTEEAKCELGNKYGAHPKATPGEDCSCGFHAYNLDNKELVREGLLYEVELYGRVIEHELGYRSQFQRILKIIAPSCSGFLCENKSDYIQFSKSQPHQSTYYICEDHHLLSENKGIEIPLNVIAGKLGVEVTSEPYRAA